jgi:hypothetical protein
MDFNTGSGSGRPEDDRPLFGGETGGQPPGGPPRSPAGGTGPEFTLSDPVVSFIRAARSVILDPVGFFRGIRRHGDFINPVVFALICYEISTLLGGLIGLLLSGLLGLADTGGSLGFGAAGSIVNFVLSLIIAPILGVITLFIFAGLSHVLTHFLIGARNSGFEATTRAISYSFVYHLISWIPLIGWIIGPIYGIALSIFGIREVHATTTGRAVAVVLIAVAVLILIFFVIIAIFVALGIGAALFFESQQQQF